MVNDPVGDFITRLYNASLVKKESVSVPYSVLKHAVAEKLRVAGYVKSVEKRGKKVKKTLEVDLSYEKNGTPNILGVRRVSKPGRRLYEKAKDVKSSRGGREATILSTPKGILTDREARKENVGGETLFKIW
ncbi:MAG: 30S ribosomal protein S8 [Candidatus Paceibacterota bacterium]